MNCRLIALTTILLLTATSDCLAQDKFFSTPARGGAEGARQNAQLNTLQGELERMNTCTSAGLIFAPTHPSADENGCASEMGDRQIDGSLSVSGSVHIGQDNRPCLSDDEGRVRYSKINSLLEFCDGAEWRAIGSDSGGISLTPYQNLNVDQNYTADTDGIIHVTIYSNSGGGNWCMIRVFVNEVRMAIAVGNGGSVWESSTALAVQKGSTYRLQRLSGGSGCNLTNERLVWVGLQ